MKIIRKFVLYFVLDCILFLGLAIKCATSKESQTFVSTVLNRIICNHNLQSLNEFILLLQGKIEVLLTGVGVGDDHPQDRDDSIVLVAEDARPRNKRVSFLAHCGLQLLVL